MKTVEKYFKASNLIDFVGYNFSDCPNLSDNLIELKLSGKFGIDIERGFVPRYVFDIFLTKERIKIGFILFRVGLTEKLLKYGGHIGFEIDQNHRGNNYALKALQILIRFIKELGYESVLITCDGDNWGSRKTVENAGGTLIDLINNLEMQDNNKKINCCYYLLNL